MTVQSDTLPGTEHRLASLESHAVSADARLVQLGHDVAGLTATVSGIATDMRSIAGVVMRVEAAPKFDMMRVLTFVGVIVAIFGATSSGIIYIASNVSAPALAVQAERVSFLRERLDNGWVKGLMVIRSSGGDVTPR